MVLVSTVRANARASIGFVGVQKRTNVALARARDALVVFGHKETLLSGDREGHWTAWLRGVRILDERRFYIQEKRDGRLEAVKESPLLRRPV